jgi:hypothetical protein
MEYAVRALWTGAGVCTLAVGAVADSSWESRLVMILSGLITLLLSILLGGFVKHLAAHQDYSQSLEETLNLRAERLFDALEKNERKIDAVQSKAQCEIVQRFNAQQLAELHQKIDTLLQRRRHKESP